MGYREVEQALDHACQRGAIVVAAGGNQAAIGSSAITRQSAAKLSPAFWNLSTGRASSTRRRRREPENGDGDRRWAQIKAFNLRVP